MLTSDDYDDEEVLDLEAMRRTYEEETRRDDPGPRRQAGRSSMHGSRTEFLRAEDDEEDRSYRRMRSRRARHQLRSLVLVSLGALVLMVLLLVFMRR